LGIIDQPRVDSILVRAPLTLENSNINCTTSFFFFGGLAIHLSQAILAHLFSYNMTWGATKKEVERSNFFKEIPKIAKRFWFSMLVSFAILAGIVVVSTTLVPIQWRVPSSGWAVIFPLALVAACHILFPIILNPWLMVFSY
jgi:hypothetical protein